MVLLVLLVLLVPLVPLVHVPRAGARVTLWTLEFSLSSRSR